MVILQCGLIMNFVVHFGANFFYYLNFVVHFGANFFYYFFDLRSSKTSSLCNVIYTTSEKGVALLCVVTFNLAYITQLYTTHCREILNIQGYNGFDMFNTQM